MFMDRRPQVLHVQREARPDRQVVLFSAEWSPAVEDLANAACSRTAIYVRAGTVEVSEGTWNSWRPHLEVVSFWSLLAKRRAADFPTFRRGPRQAGILVDRVSRDLSKLWEHVYDIDS